MKNFSLLLISLLLFRFCLIGQNDSTLFSNNTIFESGIYKSFSDFKRNRPILFKEIIIGNDQSVFSDGTLPTNNTESKLSYSKKDKNFDIKSFLIYKNGKNQIDTLPLDSIWGYSNGQNIYIKKIRMNKEIFCLLSIKGAICHFSGYGTNYINPINLAANNYASSQLSGGYMNMGSGVSSKKVDEFLLCMHNGKIYEFTEENLLKILDRDPTLKNEYLNKNTRNKKKKKEKMYRFLFKYNQSHPFYFPKS